jgi:biopolymer transport protein ExbD
MPEANINVTSLLDITFVLLISFMVVAPTIRYEVGLKLPQVSTATTVSKDKPVSVQVRSLGGGAAYFVNGKEVPIEAVVGEIKGAKDYSEAMGVALEADRAAPWESVADLMSILKANEINQISVVTEIRRQ